MKCIHCQLDECIKKGIRNYQQRYLCKACGCSFQSEYTYNAYRVATNQKIIVLLKESCGIRSIARILKISTKTVLSRMLKISKTLHPRPFFNLGCKFEVDEIWTFTHSKKNVIWITYALDRESKAIIDFIVGGKSKLLIRPLIDKLLLLKPSKIYTDKLNIYPSLIPKSLHSNYNKCTNKIERMNLTLRTHIKRLQRRTICFSKKREYLEAHLRIYFWA